MSSRSLASAVAEKFKVAVYGLTILLILPVFSWAQFSQRAFEYRVRPDSSVTGSLQFHLENFNYVRNYEFFNQFQDGYTLYGAQLMPQFVYQAHANLAVIGGAYLRKDFGAKGFFDIQPLISLKYQKNSTTLIFGALEGNVQHRYIDPLFDLERKITNPLEYGTQLILQKERFFMDTWISWEQMIYKPSPIQEVISGGVSAEQLLSDKNGLRFSLPVQFVATHEGGQIDTGLTLPLTTLFNGAVGFKLRKQLSADGKIKDIFTENYLVGYKDFSPIKRRAFQGGSGIWLNAGITTSIGTFVASYWQGNGFISIKGMPLFQSVSQNINYPGYAEKSRKVLMIRHSMQKELL
ncbi:MAG: hypothetical protein EOO04_35150, partial [Chitinophagaceae bacterium]